MLSRLGHIADRYFITLVYAILGWANAESWPYLLVFVAFGAAIDVWLVKPNAMFPGELLTAAEITTAKAKWNRTIPIVIGVPLIGISILVAMRTLGTHAPEDVTTIGPAIYGLASPYIALLRHHYQDLLAHDLLDRAQLVAVNYTGLFLLFYVGLGLWLATLRNIGAFDYMRISGYSLKQKIAVAFLLVIAPVMFVVTLYLTTSIDIDYHDENFRGRHINTNVAKYDSFFWDLAFLLGATGGALLLVLQMLFRGTLIWCGLMKVDASRRPPELQPSST